MLYRKGNIMVNKYLKYCFILLVVGEMLMKIRFICNLGLMDQENILSFVIFFVRMWRIGKLYLYYK